MSHAGVPNGSQAGVGVDQALWDNLSNILKSGSTTAPINAAGAVLSVLSKVVDTETEARIADAQQQAIAANAVAQAGAVDAEASATQGVGSGLQDGLGAAGHGANAVKGISDSKARSDQHTKDTAKVDTLTQRIEAVHTKEGIGKAPKDLSPASRKEVESLKHERQEAIAHRDTTHHENQATHQAQSLGFQGFHAITTAGKGGTDAVTSAEHAQAQRAEKMAQIAADAAKAGGDTANSVVDTATRMTPASTAQAAVGR